MEQYARSVGLARSVRPALASPGSRATNFAVGAARAYDDGVNFNLTRQVDTFLLRSGGAVGLLNELIRTGQTKEALEGADRVAHLFASRPAPEGLAFFATYGMARRRNDDLVGAALCYEIAIMIASASRDTTENVGVVYDNLATVRRLQQRFDDAATTSDRALAIFEQRLGARHGTYGVTLNNRALIHLDAGNVPLALEYSERALTVLREALIGDKAGL